MASTDVARVLMKQYVDSFTPEDNSRSSDPIFAKFKDLCEKLKKDGTAVLTNPKSNSWLADLNDALTDWRMLKDQNNPMKKIFPMSEWSAINSKVGEIKKQITEASSSSTGSSIGLSQPSLLKFDRHTYYTPNKPDQKDQVSDDQHKEQMVDWLLKPGDFKAIGICGTGCSGKTSLVKNVLKQKTVREKFKCIIWACLSELTCAKEVDKWIINYLLYRLGLDTDSLACHVEEDNDWKKEEVKRRLMKSGNYILVLDDMWHCSEWFAEEIIGKMLKNIKGGVVIVTSRRKTVAQAIGEKNMLISLLSSKEYLGN